MAVRSQVVAKLSEGLRSCRRRLHCFPMMRVAFFHPHLEDGTFDKPPVQRHKRASVFACTDLRLRAANAPKVHLCIIGLHKVAALRPILVASLLNQVRSLHCINIVNMISHNIPTTYD